MIYIIKKRLNKILGRELGKDILFTFIAQLCIMLIALLINKVLSLKLGVEGYGYYSIIRKSSAVISFVMLGGMGIALPRYLSIEISNNDNKKAKSVIISTIIIVLLISIIVIIASYLLKKDLSDSIVADNTNLYSLTIFYSFTLTISSLLYAYFRGLGAFIHFGISQISIQLLILINALIFGHNLSWVLLAWSLSTLFCVFIAIFFETKRNEIFKNNKINFKPDILNKVKSLTLYGTPRLFGDFFLFTLVAFPLIFIKQKLDIESSSYFAVGLTLTQIILPLFSFVGMILLPHVSKSIATNNFNESQKLIKNLIHLYIVLSIMAIIILCLGTEFIITVLFSEEFTAAIQIVRIIVLTILTESLYSLLRNPIDAASKIPYNTINLFISLSVLVILFYFSKTLEQFAISFLIVSVLKAVLTVNAWKICKKRIMKNQLFT